MSNVQLPAWLAVVLAMLALGAPSAAAWVQGLVVSNREDTRWERERKLQDERWHREQQREQALKLFEERKTAYAHVITASSSCMYYLSYLRHLIATNEVAQRDSKKIDRLMMSVYDAAAVVELVGDAHVESASTKAIMALTDYLGVLEECAERGQLTEESERLFIESSATFQELRKAAQRDIKSLLPFVPAEQPAKRAAVAD
ncbi:hypothetical protein ACWGE0_31420 [Lentzea sp. NPDC054927]